MNDLPWDIAVSQKSKIHLSGPLAYNFDTDFPISLVLGVNRKLTLWGKNRANCPKIFYVVERGEGVLQQSPDIFLILKSVAYQTRSKQKSTDYRDHKVSKSMLN